MELIRKIELRSDGLVVALPRRDVTPLRPGDWYAENGHIKAWDGELWVDRPDERALWQNGGWSANTKPSSLDDLEAKLTLMKEARDVERALDLCRAAVVPEHETRILSIRAEGAAETERSIILPMTIGESTEIFGLVAQQLAQRLEKLKSRLGVV